MGEDTSNQPLLYLQILLTELLDQKVLDQPILILLRRFESQKDFDFAALRIALGNAGQLSFHFHQTVFLS